MVTGRNLVHLPSFPQLLPSALRFLSPGFAFFGTFPRNSLTQEVAFCDWLLLPSAVFPTLGHDRQVTV